MREIPIPILCFNWDASSVHVRTNKEEFFYTPKQGEYAHMEWGDREWWSAGYNSYSVPHYIPTWGLRQFEA
jgi:hypothetical protein